MSMLPAEAIQEFKTLYKKRYGTQLTEREAVFRANNIIDLYRFAWESASKRAQEDNDKDKNEAEATQANR